MALPTRTISDPELKQSAICMVRMLMYLDDEAAMVLMDEVAVQQLRETVRHIRGRFQLREDDLFPDTNP